MAWHLVGERGVRAPGDPTVHDAWGAVRTAGAPGTERGPFDPPAADPPLIGRENVLGGLLDLVKSVVAGRGGVCLVTGEAGIGKTRLLGDLATRAGLLGCQVLSGRAQDYDHGVSYSALKDILASIDAAELDGVAAAELGTLVEATERVVLGRPETQDGRSQSPYVLTTRLLQTLTAARPCVVVLDDAHLADDESLTALSLAARHLAGRPLMLLFAARSDKWLPGTGFAATVGRLVERGLGTAVELGALDEADIRAFLGAALDGRPSDRLLQHVYAQSRGNPLFARETLLSLLQRGAVQLERGTYYLTGEPTPGIVTRRGALLHRVFQQDEANRQLARALSAFGRVNLEDLPLLSELTGLSADEIQHAFDGLTQAAILRRVDQGWYEFSHPLVAEVLYDDLGPAERRRIHRMISEELDRSPRNRVGLLQWATHVLEAAAPGDARAIDVAVSAAAATRNHAPLSAARWYQRALDLLPEDAPERGRLLAWQTVAYWKGARPEFAVATGQQALAVLPPDRLHAATLATVINALYAMGRLEDALEWTGRAGDRSPARVSFLAQRGLVLAHLGRREEALQLADLAREALVGSSLEQQALAHSYIGHIEYQVGTFHRMEEASGRLHEIGTSGDQGPAIGARRSALESAASVLGIAGSWARAHEMLDLAEDVLPLSGQLDLGGQTMHTLARGQFYSGQWEQALETVRAGAVNLEFAGLALNLGWLRLVEVEVLLERGAPAEAELALERVGACDQWASLRAVQECLRGAIALVRQDREAAGAVFGEQLAHGRRHGWNEVQRRALDGLVHLHLDAGEQAEAARVARELTALADANGMPSSRWTADLAVALTSRQAAPARRALELARAEGVPFIEARAHHVLAEVGDDPVANLLRASQLYEQMGAQLWLKRATAYARENGVHLGRPPARSAPAGDGLTATERQLVALVRDGLSNLEIARTMHYSRKTVEAYLSRLYRKVGCTSRVGLVVAAERDDLLKEPAGDL